MTHRDAQPPVDVIVLGGGFAGLTLTRHLRLHLPELTVAVVEPTSPPPRHTHKVGESSLAPQGHYLARWLRLEHYLEEEHVEKFGVRYFFGEPEVPFGDRPEVGARSFLRVKEFQVDRGKLEADLRATLTRDGVQWCDGRVRHVALPSGEEELAEVSVEGRSGEARTLRARWVVDASGRRRLLHRQRHGSTRPAGRCSAAWFRVKGWIDVADFVPPGEDWHDRVAPTHPRTLPFGRVNSTNHLCGVGRWVWLIPLPDDVMSVGIVAMDELVPFSSYSTAERADRWLEANEPQLAEALRGRERLDFRTMPRYSYPVGEFISPNRWAMVGNALGFVDPFYSPGGDMIALSNLLIVETIRRDRRGTLAADACARLTAYMRRHQGLLVDVIQSIYPLLGAPRVAGARVLWDFASLIMPLTWVIDHFDAELYDFLCSDAALAMLDRMAALQREVTSACEAWAKDEQDAHLASLLDHSDRLNALVDDMTPQAASSALPRRVELWLADVERLSRGYLQNGPAWSLFDPQVSAPELSQPASGA